MDHDQAQLALHEGSLSAALITPAADANGWRILLVARTGEQTPYTGHSGTEKVYHDLDQAIKDYATLCESYVDAVKSLPPARIEAIDMGKLTAW